MLENSCSIVKIKLRHISSLYLSAVFFMASASASVITVPTADKQATLNIVVDRPALNKLYAPAPVIVFAGGVFTDRDCITGSGNADGSSDNYFLFAMLAKRLTKLGFVVVRYDQRGINGNVFTCVKGEKQAINKYLAKCVDSNVRSMVTASNMHADYETVFNFARQLKDINVNTMYALGHSEGAVHISKLVEERRIKPVGIIFVAGVAESPATHIKWQTFDRFLEALFLADGDKDGVITNQEIHHIFLDKKSIFSTQITNLESIFMSPTGSWQLADLSTLRLKLEQQIYAPLFNNVNVKNADKVGALGTFETFDVTVASRAWILDRMNDRTPVANRLDKFPGAVIALFFSLDVQISVPKQLDAFNKSKIGRSKRFSTITFNGYGHTLGKLAYGGKVEQKAIDDVSTAIKVWSEKH